MVLVTGAGAVTASFGSVAQAARKVAQVGYLGNSSPTAEADLLAAFKTGLRERGYTEGRDVVVHTRWAAGRIDDLPRLAGELVAQKVDVLVTSGTPAVLAAKKATSTIPIVMAAIGDAVATGVVTSMARPGGNITGLSTLYADLEGKRLQVLREVLPKLARLALLANPANPFTRVMLKATHAASKTLQMVTQTYEVSALDQFERVFAAIRKGRHDALTVLADRPFLVSNRARIVAFAAQAKLPAIYPFPEFVEDGGLIFYGPSFVDMFQRAATYVDKILKGAKPAGLPLEQPGKFDLVLNTTTAKTLGIKVPQSVLLQATRVIE